MVPLKRRKVSSGNTGNTGSESKFPEVVLFLLERKMGTSRRAFLSQLGRKKGFKVEELFSESVTHVISENNSGDEVRTWLDSQVKGQTDVQLLDISWYTESMRAGRPVDILDRHKLQEQQIKDSNKKMLFSVPSYACQRRTTLDNHNTVLTDALLLLAENAELSDEDGRGVAFRRAAAVLKALPEPVTDTRQLRGLPCLGGHSLRVIKEILENGASSEVESTKQSERFRALKVLTGIFGVGVKTAERWIRDGILGLQQLKDSRPTLNRAQQAGLEHYDDLKQQVSKAEADAIGQIVEEAVAFVLPGARVTLIGGFRRGKQTGHDVDFLITHPEDGREVGLMPKVVSWLESKGFLLYQKTTRNSYLESEDGPGRPSSNMDRFERCFSIFKLSKDEKWTEDSPEDKKQTEDSPEDKKKTEDSPEDKKKTEDSPEDKKWTENSPEDKKQTEDSPEDKKRTENSPEDKKRTEDSPEDKKRTEDSPEDNKRTKDSPEDEKRTEDSPEDKKRTEDSPEDKKQTKDSPEDKKQTDDSPEDKKRTEDSPEDKKQTDDSPEDKKRTEDSPEDSSSPAAGSRVKDQQINPWRAVRVDLVVSPISQFAFALLGWTGSKLFERELRRWAGQEKAMSLSSHALYDNKQNQYLRATSEEEIFAHLGLEYIPPTERNA